MLDAVKRLLLASLCIFAVGCGGNSSNSNASFRFAGTYEGTWVSTADETDHGTASWLIRSDGTFEGRDVDSTDGTIYMTGGNINASGNVQSVTLPHGGDPVNMNGTLQFNTQNQLTGVLVWQANPPISYRYTLTPVAP